MKGWRLLRVGGLALFTLNLMVACGAQEATGGSGAINRQVAPTDDQAARSASPAPPASPEVHQNAPPTPEAQPIMTATDPVPPAEPAPTEAPREEAGVVITSVAPEPAGDDSSAAPPPPAGDGGQPVAVTAGVVSLIPDAPTVGPGGELTLTVANGLDRPLYSDDMKTGCSIVTLESWDGAAWLPVNDCGLERLPLTLMISPGHGRAVVIRPFGPASQPLRPGSYRVRFNYRLAQEPQGEEPEMVVSAPFELK